MSAPGMACDTPDRKTHQIDFTITSWVEKDKNDWLYTWKIENKSDIGIAIFQYFGWKNTRWYISSLFGVTADGNYNPIGPVDYHTLRAEMGPLIEAHNSRIFKIRLAAPPVIIVKNGIYHVATKNGDLFGPRISDSPTIFTDIYPQYKNKIYDACAGFSLTFTYFPYYQFIFGP